MKLNIMEFNIFVISHIRFSWFLGSESLIGMGICSHIYYNFPDSPTFHAFWAIHYFHLF